MRIFQVLSATANASIAQNSTWRRNLYEPLIDLGHDVYLFSSDDGKCAMRKKDLTKKKLFSEKLFDTFVLEHKRKPFSLFFAYLMEGMIDVDVIDKIRGTGVLTCNFSCNNAHQFDLVKTISPHFDFNLHSEKYAAHKFKEINANALWWPMASNPKYFKPLRASRHLDVSFVGANYGLRCAYVYHLLKKGINIHAYGPGWQKNQLQHYKSLIREYIMLLKTTLSFSQEKRYRLSAYLQLHALQRLVSLKYKANLHRPISDEKLISLYSESKISLGVIEVYDGHNPANGRTRHMHLREFEAPMCGALYCTGYCPELTEMFEIDKEVVVYHDEEELAEKVHYYLNHPDQADKIRAAGLKRALADHTYHKRYKDLFVALGLHK